MEDRKIIMCKTVDKEQKRNMVSKINPNDKRVMARVVNKGPENKVYHEKQEPIQVLMCRPVDKNKSNSNDEKITKKVEIGFREAVDGLYLDDVHVMNATVEILDIQSAGELSGEGEKVHCKVHVFNKPSIEKIISVREFREGRWLWDYAAIVFKCEKRQALDKIYQYMNFLLEQADVTISSFRERQGWTTANDKNCYVTTDGIVGGDTSVRSRKGVRWKPMLSLMHQAKCFEFFVGMKNVTKQNATAIILMLYLVQSTLYSLYKEAKVVPKYCIFVEGTKGAHKTSLVMALTKPTDDAVPKFTFKDTQAGLETGFAENADAIMVIDDLMPTEDNSARKKLESNLEFITRCFGDANGKNRNLDFCDNKGPKAQYVTHGGVVFTGEYMNSMCASSLARTLVLHIDNQTVDTKQLSFYQKNKQLLSSFLQFFIMHVAENYQQSVKIIADIVMDERQRLNGQFSNARYCEYLAQLKAAAIVLAMYGFSIQCVENINDFVNDLMQSVQTVIRLNDIALKDEDPAKRIATAIIEGIGNKTLKVLKEKQIAEDDNCVVISEDFLYMTEKGLVQCYREYMIAHGYRNLDYKDSTLKNLLVNANVLQVQHEGEKKRYTTKITGQKNKRFLQLNKKELYKVAEDETEGLR